VVDDLPVNRAVLRELLSPLGFHVREANDGAAALRMVQEQLPDLILMDLALPGLDGCEIIRRVRQRPELRDVVIIACSANLSQERITESMQAGSNDFLPKPIAMATLLEQLERHLGLTWQRRTTSDAVRSALDTTPMKLPPADVLSALVDLAEHGQIEELLACTEQLERTNVQLRPWLRQVQVLAQSFELDELWMLLQASVPSP